MPVRLVLHVIFTFSVKQVNLPTNRSVVKAEPPKKESAAPPEVKQAPAAGDKPAQKSEKPDKKEKKDKKKPAAEGGKDFCRLIYFLVFFFVWFKILYPVCLGNV